MIDLKKLIEEWKQDSEIERNNLDEASRVTPSLHAKYLGMMMETRLKLKDCEFKQKVLLKDKWLYYNGKMSQKDIESRGWDPDPLDGLKILKGEMDYYYDSDPEIVESEAKIAYIKTVIDTLEEIIQNLKWRHQTIKNMIEWRRFESGV